MKIGCGGCRVRDFDLDRQREVAFGFVIDVVLLYSGGLLGCTSDAWLDDLWKL